MPEMGESVTEGTVLEWLKEPGDDVDEGDPVVEVSTDKVDAEVPSPVAGTLLETLVEPDDVVKVGQALARIQAGGECAVRRADGGRRTSRRLQSRRRRMRRDGGKASPVARRIAAAEGVDLGAVTGSGAGGRIMKADVIAAAESGNGAAAPAAAAAGEAKVLRGPAGMLAKAMEESRSIPTATSFRTLAVDTLDAKRKALNGALSERGMKVSFTHLIAWAIVEAGREWPAMARSFEVRDDKPNVVEHGAINLGIAVDVEKKDGSRTLMVPCIPAAHSSDFKSFHAKYEELVRKTRENALTADDFVGTNITLTNPGGLGTVASVPRLMTGQGTIIATGSIAYPPEWSHSPAERLKTLGVSKVMTMTSTYDHRIIQGAESGSFLRRIEELLSGEDEFYEGVARALDDRRRHRHQGPPGLRLGAAARRRLDDDGSAERRPGDARRGAAAGRPGGDLVAQGLPDPRPPRREPEPARRRRQGRSRARAGEPEPDAGADGPDPGLDPADRRPRRDPARRAAADARASTAGRSATRSSISPRTSSASGCAR